ncbi:MAG: Ig-like domain-containing protein [Oscillospiraceae bacterium]|nr:Ig-like domain-containing protein [Oscillospiraceae bacterium]
MKKHRNRRSKLTALLAAAAAAAMSLSVLSGCSQTAPDSEPAESNTEAVSSVENSSVSDALTAEPEETTQTEATEPPPPVELPEGAVTDVTADDSKGGYISATTSFTLTSKEDMEADELSALIKLSPDIPFELEKTKERTYVLHLSDPIPDNKILKLSLSNGRSWAFQTADIFRISGVFPANEADYVPMNSGIEMTFTSPVDVSTAKDNFTIFPEVPGRFELHNNGKTLVFAPEEKLTAKTVYKVNISKNLSSLSGDTLPEDYSFEFQTKSSDSADYCYASQGLSETFIPGDVVLTEIYASENVKKGNFEVKLYQYPSSADYLAQMQQVAAETKSTFFKEDGIIIPPSDNMTLVYSKTVKLKENGRSNWYPSYLMLPDDLAEGYYLVNIRSKVGDFVIDRFIQITDISVYSAILPGSAAFFVNDASNGNPANGAKVNITDGGKSYSCTIDKNGTGKAEIDNSEHGKSVITIDYNGKTYIDFFPLRDVWEKELRDNYLIYLYTDREIYRTTDTVNVWGTVYPRYQGISPPKDLTLAMHYYSADGEPVPVSVNSDGTFTAKVPVNSARDGWYDLTLKSGNEELYEKYLRIEDYVKPSYNIETDGTDVVFMGADNPFEVTLDASYYDGTPAAALSFDVSGADVTSASTDENGHISVTAAPGKEAEKDARPSRKSVGFTMSGVEDEYQNIYFSYIDVDRDVYAEIVQEGEKVSVVTNLIDPDKVTKTNYYYPPEEYLGAPADTQVILILEKSWSEQIENGTYYDYLQKKTFKNYKYINHDEPVGTFVVNTVNGKGVFDGIEFDDKSSYRGTLKWTDTYGNKCTDRVWLKNPNIPDRYDRSESTYNYFSLKTSKPSFKENETLHFDLQNNYSNSDSSDFDKIFYTVSQFDFISMNVVNGISFDCKMTADCIPNVQINGAYFDGRHIYPLHSLDYSDYDWGNENYYYYYGGLSFDTSERKLDITVTADKETYAPGDEVKITVKAADINGKPAANASVSLSVVDEAVFAIAPQNPNPRYDLYRSLSIPWVTDYYSYIQYSLNMNGGGEKGGGGDDYSVRRDFRDTAAFLTGTTNSSGVAEFTFKSPDNITSWRATAHAVSKRANGVYAGVSKEPVIVTLPFFITPVVNDTFIQGDDIAFAAKTTAGNAELTVHVEGNDVNETVTVPEISSAKFGKLKKGDYTVTISAKSGNDSDAVELPFSVVDTLLETEVVREFDLTKDTFEISPLRYPVKLLFYDTEYTLYANALSKLSCLWGDRADYKLARAFAAKEFGWLTEEEYQDRFTSFKSSGLISLWSYSEDDPRITALIAAAEPELTAGEATKTAFREILDNENSIPENVSSAYLGLAALGEPVLADLKRTLIETEGFSDTDMLRFAAALGIMGDLSSGAEIFEDVCSRIMTGYTTKDGAPALKTDSEYNDLAALMAASALNLDHAELLAEHAVVHEQVEESCAPYLIFYLKNYTPDSREISEPAAVEITANGKTETVTVNSFGRTFRSLNKSQVEAEDFSVTLKNGSVKCLAYYEGRITDNLTPKNLTVTKSIQSVSGGYAPGALLKVTVNVSGFPDLENLYAAVDDVIPSGARFVKSGESSYVSRSDMRVSGSVSYNNGGYRPMVYYIRLVTPGEYVVESAAARQGNELWGYSERRTLTVEEYSANA